MDENFKDLTVNIAKLMEGLVDGPVIIGYTYPYAQPNSRPQTRRFACNLYFTHRGCPWRLSIDSDLSVSLEWGQWVAYDTVTRGLLAGNPRCYFSAVALRLESQLADPKCFDKLLDALVGKFGG